MPELRIVDDPSPYASGFQWRMNDLMLEWRYKGKYMTGRWQPGPAGFVHIPERVAVWRDLFLNPCVADA